MNDALADAVRHFLNALDKGYFDHKPTVCGHESAFVMALRDKLAEHDAAKVARMYESILRSLEDAR